MLINHSIKYKLYIYQIVELRCRTYIGNSCCCIAPKLFSSKTVLKAAEVNEFELE